MCVVTGARRIEHVATAICFPRVRRQRSRPLGAVRDPRGRRAPRQSVARPTSPLAERGARPERGRAVARSTRGGRAAGRDRPLDGRQSASARRARTHLPRLRSAAHRVPSDWCSWPAWGVVAQRRPARRHSADPQTDVAPGSDPEPQCAFKMSMLKVVCNSH